MKNARGSDVVVCLLVCLTVAFSIGCGGRLVATDLENASAAEYDALWKARKAAFEESQRVHGAAPGVPLGLQRMELDAQSTEQMHLAYQKAREMHELYRVSEMASTDPRWELVGPTNIPGRIASVAAHPSDPNTVFAGLARGGLFKSTDRGATWTAVFDEIGSLPVGGLAIDPTDPQTIYAGTGDVCGAWWGWGGNGVYKSTDGGDSWQHIGLGYARIVGQIVVDPLSPSTVFVAVRGLWGSEDSSGGLYRSTDAGTTWTKKLYIDKNTGFSDIALHSDSGVMLATAWQTASGTGSGLWRSEDRGETWTDITGTRGLPNHHQNGGRVSVTMGSAHNVAYAKFAGGPGVEPSYLYGLYKSRDLGRTWSRLTNPSIRQIWISWGGDGEVGMASYLAGPVVSPTNPDVVMALGTNIWRSTDGGYSWSNLSAGVVYGGPYGPPHVDNHALWFLPGDDRFFFLGGDGGMYHSDSRGDTWTQMADMANTQFYACEIDHLNPGRVYGGAQDNSTLRSTTGAVDDWEIIDEHDGCYVVVDPTNSDVIYSTWTHGFLRKSYDGGRTFSMVMNGMDATEPAAVMTPLVMSPNDPNVLYAATDRIYKSVDGANRWMAISPALTLDGGYITTVGVSGEDDQVVYAGGNQGEVWVTRSGGALWTQALGLPWRWVTRVVDDPSDASIAYVTLSYFGLVDGAPHIFRTEDYGQTWESISGNLPSAPINDVVIDPFNENTLFVGTAWGYLGPLIWALPGRRLEQDSP